MNKWFTLTIGDNITSIAAGVFVSLLLCYWYHRPKNFPPGPRGLPLLGVIPFLGRYFERSAKKWSETYGPVLSLRMGREDFVVLNDYESIYEVSTDWNRWHGKKRHP